MRVLTVANNSPVIIAARSPTLVSLSYVRSVMEVQAVSLTTFTHSVMTVVPARRVPGGITYDALRGQIFVSFGDVGSITQLRLDGGGSLTLVDAAATGCIKFHQLYVKCACDLLVIVCSYAQE